LRASLHAHEEIEVMPRTLQIIAAQQRAMSSALLAIRTIARRALRSTAAPDFSQLAALARYVERFPETIHQSNEERLLFQAIESRQPTLARTVARFRRDHAAIKGYGNRLRSALRYWQQGDPQAGPQVAVIADDYVRYSRQHARAEQALLSAEIAIFSGAELTQIDRAFDSALDPLARSENRQTCARALRQLASQFAA
jgi:hemerythrin-like domain-containing protein